MLTIYKASAGSGKTFTLAFQYIKLLLAYFEPSDHEEGIFFDEEGREYTPYSDNGKAGKTCNTSADKDNTTVSNNTICTNNTPGTNDADPKKPKGRWRLYPADGPRSRHRSILAVTFTHKATEEMKKRIVDKLREIVDTATAEEGKRSDYAQKLLDLTGCKPEQLKESAEKALDDLLYDFHFFNVSTIDSFFQQVLRGFAREVSQNEDFALEIDNTVAVTMGVDSMLNSINVDPSQQTRTLENFIEDWMRSEYRAGRIGNMFNRNANIYRKLVQFVASTMSEEFKEHSEEVIEYLKGDPDRFARFRKALFNRYDQIPVEVSGLAVRALNILNASDKFVQDNINNYAKSNLEKIAGPKAGYGQEEFKLDANTWAVSKPQFVEAAFGDQLGLFKKAYSKKTSEVPQPLCDAIARTFDAVIKGSVERKWLRAVTNLLSHFGVLVSALEFIMQYRQDNNLILLSDTNELLQKVIDDNDAPFIYEKLGNILEYYLIDEFQDTSRLQWDNLRPLVDNAVSLGNENLIIGDEKQSIYRFRNADAELLNYKAEEDIGEDNCDVRGSGPGENTNYRSSPAVVRFNNTLFSYLGKKVGTKYFDNVVQDIPPINRNKRGHIRFDVIQTPKKGEFVDIVLPRLVSDIRSLLQRGFERKDIVILVRTKKEGNAVVEHLLQQNDPEIVVASDESLKLTMSPSVRVIISTLRMFTLHREPDPDASVDSDLEMRINEVEFLNSISNDMSKAILDIVGGNKEDFNLLESVINYRSTNLFTLTEKIIQDVLTPEMRQRDSSYIMAFQDYVTKFCSQFTSNVRKFLRWWDMNEKNLTIAASPNVEAIRVMTIHKSKGLEFKCVLLPFTDINVKGKEELWLKGDCLKGVPSLKIADTDIPPLLRVEGSSALNYKECPFYQDYKQWRQNQKTDMLNVGYVAFTRAEHELIGYINLKPSKSADSAEKSKKANTSTDDEGPDVTNIGQLVVEAFQNVNTKEIVEGYIPTDDEEELFYCKNREVIIPRIMPLEPYYHPKEFDSLEDYICGIDEMPFNQNKEADTINTTITSTSSVGLNESDKSDVDESVDEGLAEEGLADEEPAVEGLVEEEPAVVEEMGGPFLIHRFEYGTPSVFPFMEETPKEKQKREEKQAKEKAEKLAKENDKVSTLDSVKIGAYQPTFPKNVEHYFTVKEEKDSYEEENISSDAGDSPSAKEKLPGGYDPQTWGEILHRVMSYIHCEEDTERAIARVTRQYHMDGASCEYLRKRIWAAVKFDHPLVRLWFDRRRYANVVTERPLYDPASDTPQRPDRIVWYKDGSADIVDYKFGTLEFNDYDYQMKEYMRIVEYTGVPKVRGFIYFPGSKLIKEIHR